jgi:hypothetical protein
LGGEYVDGALRVHDFVEEVHASVVGYCHVLSGALGNNELTEADLADAGYLLRESERWLDEARKEVKAKKETIGRILAVLITRRVMEDPDEEPRARGELCTATPDVAIRPKLPKAGTEEYSDLMRWLGVPVETVEGGVLNVHFNRMSEMLTRMAEEGKTPHPGLVGTYTDTSCVFRRTNNPKKR